MVRGLQCWHNIHYGFISTLLFPLSHLVDFLQHTIEYEGLANAAIYFEKVWRSVPSAQVLTFPSTPQVDLIPGLRVAAESTPQGGCAIMSCFARVNSKGEFYEKVLSDKRQAWEGK